MAIDFLFIHGTKGRPDGNWFPWLKRELESYGHRVKAPSFPTPDGQNLTAWLAVMREQLQDCKPSSTVLVGHSVGAIAALHAAALSPCRFMAVFGVSPFCRDLGLDPYDRLNASFVHSGVDWARVRQNSGKLFFYAGDDDPYVPLAYAQEVADLAGGPLTVIEKGGHLNAEFGWKEFPLLRDTVLKHCCC